MTNTYYFPLINNEDIFQEIKRGHAMLSVNDACEFVIG